MDNPLRQKILELVKEYYFSEKKNKKEFVPGKTWIPYAGRIFDDEELVNLVGASLDFWLTLGPWGNRFEKKISEILGVPFTHLTNSGSSANLLAFGSLFSSKLERPLKPSDEVITVAAGFPTTLNPILQYGCLPVVVDVSLETLLPKIEWIEEAITPKTRAIFLAHTLGNVLDVDGILELCRRHNLYFIEDNCDALDSEYKGKKTGSFGTVSTLSLYPSHHITTGEGGCVFTHDETLSTIIQSLRDWGKDCWCQPGVDNTCGKRFGWQLGDLPLGYDHKYIFSHIGYNMKPTDLQAAIGCAQIEKLPAFTKARRENYQALAQAILPFEKWITPVRAALGANPSWFMFFMVISEQAPFTREALAKYLEENKIQTRMLFGGNLLKQPAYQNQPHRVAMPLANTDILLHRGLGVGVYPGITPPMRNHMIQTLTDFLKRF